MLKIFPLREAALDFEDRYNLYLEAQGYPFHRLTYLTETGETIVVEQPPKLLEWRELIHCALDDQLNHTLRWTDPTDREKAYLARMFPLYAPQPDDIPRFRRLTEQRIAELQQRLSQLQVFQRQEPQVELPPAGVFIREEIRFVETPDDPFAPQLTKEARYLDPRGRALRQRDEARKRLQREIASVQHQLQGAQIRLKLMAAPDEAYLNACDKFHQQILVVMWDQISEWLDESLGADEDSHWRIWALRALGEDLALESGQDYRVFDWERRMKSGVWNREEASHPFHG